jgi:general secretion pathway protein G
VTRRGRAPQCAGFTLLELVVVVALVGIFASVALERLLRYQEIAEKASMEQTLSALRSAERLQAAARILRGGNLSSLAGLADENPIDWLQEPPAGYVGALHDATGENVPKGSWYFDLKNKELGYRPQRIRFLSSGPDGSDRLRFKVIVRVGGGDGPGAPQELSELAIQPVPGARWTPGF